MPVEIGLEPLLQSFCVLVFFSTCYTTLVTNRHPVGHSLHNLMLCAHPTPFKTKRTQPVCHPHDSYQAIQICLAPSLQSPTSLSERAGSGAPLPLLVPSSCKFPGWVESTLLLSSSQPQVSGQPNEILIVLMSLIQIFQLISFSRMSLF